MTVTIINEIGLSLDPCLTPQRMKLALDMFPFQFTKIELFEITNLTMPIFFNFTPKPSTISIHKLCVLELIAGVSIHTMKPMNIFISLS